MKAFSHAVSRDLPRRRSARYTPGLHGRPSTNLIGARSSLGLAPVRITSTHGLSVEITSTCGLSVKITSTRGPSVRVTSTRGLSVEITSTRGLSMVGDS